MAYGTTALAFILPVANALVLAIIIPATSLLSFVRVTIATTAAVTIATVTATASAPSASPWVRCCQRSSCSCLG